MAAENGRTPRATQKPRRLVALAFAVLASALLLAGSYATIAFFFGPVDNPARLSRSDLIAYGAFLYWPITVAVFWLTTLPVLVVIGRPRILAIITVSAGASMACPFMTAWVLHFSTQGSESGGLPGVVVRTAVIVAMLVMGSGWLAVIWRELVQPLRQAQRS